jgi:uncharacterized membrane protein YphA (DoxX/SURF4 family)
MLSLFPQLFDYAVPATAVLRFVTAIILIIEAKRSFSIKQLFPTESNTCSSVRKIFAITELAGGIFLLIGLFTQAVSLALALVVIKHIIDAYRSKVPDKRIYSFYAVLLFMILSFLFFGPGMISIDFPL